MKNGASIKKNKRYLTSLRKKNMTKRSRRKAPKKMSLKKEWDIFRRGMMKTPEIKRLKSKRAKDKKIAEGFLRNMTRSNKPRKSKAARQMIEDLLGHKINLKGKIKASKR